MHEFLCTLSYCTNPRLLLGIHLLISLPRSFPYFLQVALELTMMLYNLSIVPSIIRVIEGPTIPASTFLVLRWASSAFVLNIGLTPSSSTTSLWIRRLLSLTLINALIPEFNSHTKLMGAPTVNQAPSSLRFIHL